MDADRDISGVPKFLQPKLRLFLSADLVGSTRLKQKERFPLSVQAGGLSDGEGKDGETGLQVNRLSPPWLSRITGFYRDVENAFRGEIRTIADAHQRYMNRKLLALPELWKANGDELIFTAVLQEMSDAVYLLAAWVSALRAVVPELRCPADGGDSLDIKAAAWVAGFPISNAEIVFRQRTAQGGDDIWNEESVTHHFGLLEQWYSGAREGLMMDFIGPSVDVGFRIAAQATRGKLILSPDVALILSHEKFHHAMAETLNIEDGFLNVRYDGRRSLKGVLDDDPYPLFWIDLSPADALAQEERKLTEFNPDNIAKFCEHFFRHYIKKVIRPFIYKCSNNHFSSLPSNYLEHLRLLVDAWDKDKNRLKRRDAMATEVLEAEPEGDAAPSIGLPDFPILSGPFQPNPLPE